MKSELIHIQPIIFELLSEFKKWDVAYCLLKGYETFPFVNKGSDIDLLLLDKDWGKGLSIFSNVLTQLGFKIFQTFDHQYVLGYAIFKNHIALHFDFFKNIDFMGVTYISGEQIIRHRQWKAYYYSASLTHTALTGWLQNMLYGRTQKQKYNDLITNALVSEKELFSEQVNKIFNPRTSNQLLKQLNNRDFNSALRLRNKIVRQVSINHFLRHPINTIINHFRTLYKHLRFRLKPDGIVVVLIGPDGCGKTTSILNIEAPLCAAQHVPSAHKFHLKPGWLPPLKKLFSPRDWGKPSAVITSVSEPHAKRPSGFFPSFLRVLYYLIDYTLGYYLKIYPKKSRHQVIIFDRYYYDFVVDPLRMKVRLPNCILEFFLKFIPKPSIVIYLDVDGATIYARKSELNVIELERQRKAFQKIVRKLPYAFTVDANRHIDDVSNSIIEHIFYKALVNGRPKK